MNLFAKDIKLPFTIVTFSISIHVMLTLGLEFNEYGLVAYVGFFKISILE